MSVAPVGRQGWLASQCRSGGQVAPRSASTFTICQTPKGVTVSRPDVAPSERLLWAVLGPIQHGTSWGRESA